jgi:hypothetical protein
MELIEVFTSDTFKMHVDKEVRKGSCKLLRDVLRGLTAIYPLKSLMNPRGDAFSSGIGSPKHASAIEVVWHIPGVNSLQAACDILRRHASHAMVKIQELLQIEGTYQDTTETASSKKVEDDVVSHLNVLRRCVRGVSDVLGDLELSGNPSKLLETGHSIVDFSAISQEDKTYLKSLRNTIVEFLNSLHGHLDSLSLNPSGTNEKTDNYDSNSVSLAHSIRIRTTASKIFKVVAIQRMANLKNVDNISKWFTVLRKMRQSALSMHMTKLMHRHRDMIGCYGTTDITDVSSLLSSVEYWAGHDVSTRTVQDRAWLQHALRQKELSFAAMRYTTSSGTLYIYMELF